MKPERLNTRKTGFAIVGTGAIAALHANAIQAIDGARLLGVYNRSRVKAEEFAGTFPCEVCDSLDELLLLDKLDIVCICTPSGLHMEPALKAIEAGKHCLIEKPLETDLEKADKIIKAAELKNVIVAVVFPGRFYQSSQHLINAVRDGRFGEMVLASAYVKWNRTAEYYSLADWRGTWKLDGGGALMNQAIHSVDMLQWCMGPVESVQAMSANRKHTNIEVEDTLVAILRFASGAMGTIECSTAIYPGTYRRIEITGTEGTVVMEENTITQWQFKTPLESDATILSPPLNNPQASGFSNPAGISFEGHQKQIENLIQAISFRGKPLIDGAEGRKSLEIVLAIYQSAKTGQLVRLPLQNL